MIDLLTALFLTSAYAQDVGVLEGIAFDGLTGLPLQEVSVQVGDLSVETDEDGYFRAELPAGAYTVYLDAPSLKDGAVEEVYIASGAWTELLLTFSERDIPQAIVQAPSDTAIASVDETLPTGLLTGVVRSTENSKPIAGARVYVRGTSGEGITDADGRYTIEVPIGLHDLTVLRNGFSTQSVPNAEVTEDGAQQDVALSPRGVALADFTISAPYIDGSTASLLDERKDSSNVADVLGAEEMSRSGDSNAASALSRVTGLTVVGGKYIFVRGLGDRYSSSLMNGSALPSPEPERRVVPLDLFPASILESVVIQKSYSPDMPGAFGGGVVQLRTKRVPTEFSAEVGLSGSYLHGTTFQQGLDYAKGPTDWLGIDGGWRGLPNSVANASANSPLEEGDMFSERGYTAEELEALGEAMPNRWNTIARELPPGYGVDLSIGHGKAFGPVAAGGLAALTFGNDWQSQAFNRRYYLVGDGGDLERSHVYDFDQSTNEIQAGAFVTTGVEAFDQAIQYTGSVVRSTEDMTRIYEGYNRDVGDDIRVTRLRWVERQLVFHHLRGEHESTPFRLDWRLMQANADRLEPDRREYRQDRESEDLWYLSDRPEGNQRFFSDLSDNTLEIGVDGTLRVNPKAETPATVKVGASWLDRSRAVDTRRYKYFHRGVALDVLENDPEQVFTPEHIGPGSLQFEEFTQPTDNYSAKQTIDGYYAMTDIPITSWLQMMGGARVERSNQQVSTFELFNPVGDTTKARLNTTDVLPAATLTLRPFENINVRGGYGKTVSRPDFREMSEAPFNDVTGGRLTFGNPDLERATIDHIDLRVEWFPSAEEVVSASVFTKNFNAPIETIVIASAQQSVTWENAEGAFNRGIEFEYRKQLLPVLFTSGNVSLIESNVDIGRQDTAVQTSTERALQGQSPYVINLQLAYDDDARGSGVTLLYNVFGRRIVEVGAQGAPDSYELPVHRLDLVAKQRLGAGFGMSIKFQNLLDAVAPVIQGNKTVEEIRNGWGVGVGIKWNPPTP